MANPMKKKKIEQYTIDLNMELGSGSYGTVYKGHDDQNNRAVAVKVLSKSKIDKDVYTKNTVFLEIKILSKLHSDNIVQIYDVLETEHNYYIVQELCDCDLRSWLKRDGRYKEEVALEMLQQICMGFLELINHGVIHRDVKPQNILIGNKVLKLADFGFAKHVLSEDHMNKTLVGTPLYMSPQHLKRERYTSKCDIWSLGLIYYQLLYGKLPWSGHSEIELLNNIYNVSLTFKGEPKISEDSQDFIRGCLQIDEKKRFSWSQLYRHPLFKKKFDGLIGDEEKSGARANYVLTQLRLKVHVQNIDLEKMIAKHKIDQQVTFEDFHGMLESIQPLIEREESHYLFDHIDQDHKGKIKTADLKKCLSSSGICLTSVQKHPELLKQSSHDVVQSTEIEDEETRTWTRISSIVEKLRQRLEAKNYDLYQVYEKYDFNKDKLLDHNQFKKLMDKVENGLSQDQLKLCFRRFDLNGDDRITFEQFYRTLCKINGDPSYVGKFAKKEQRSGPITSSSHSESQHSSSSGHSSLKKEI